MSYKISVRELFANDSLRVSMQTLVEGIGPGNTQETFLQGIVLKGRKAINDFRRAGFSVEQIWWKASGDYFSLLGTGLYFAPFNNNAVFARCEAPVCLLLPCETKLAMTNRYLHEAAPLNDIAAWAKSYFHEE